MIDPMDPFENELREQLQPREAPAGFTERVMARTAARRERRGLWIPLWRWAMAMLLLGAVLVGGAEHQRRQRIAGQRARAQVLLALRITGATLNQVQHKIQDDSPHPSRPGAQAPGAEERE